MKTIRAKEDFGLIRLRKGFTLKSLAGELGVHHTTISRIENKKTSVSPQTAKKTCELFNINFDEIFEIIEIEGE